MSTQTGTARQAGRAVLVAAAVGGTALVFGLGGDAAGGTAAGPLRIAGYGALPAVALSGGALDCGGVRFSGGKLPGRPVAEGERAGPAEGITQLLRLAEWTQRNPYDGARWSVVEPADGVALLVATGPGQLTRYTPVRRRSDGHWEIGEPCRPRLAR